MNILASIKTQIAQALNQIIGQDLVQASDFIYPPNPLMGDLSLVCFSLAKDFKKAPKEIADNFQKKFPKSDLIEEIKTAGPYLNFYLAKSKIAENLIREILKKGKNFTKISPKNKEKALIEYAQPNTHKTFHIGHLRGAITGEALARILANAGQNVVRANYQGDVGPHVAKCIWGILAKIEEYEEALLKEIHEKIDFLAKAYVAGSQSFEENEEQKEEIIEINQKIYGFCQGANNLSQKDQKLRKIYQTTLNWSLEYFDLIYKKLGISFNRLYFESEVFASGKKIVLASLQKGVFRKSQGAIIFPGEKYGLHNRVFLNSKGFPTYEAKEIGLAKLQIKEYKPKTIIHITGSEQTEYFKVVFKAIERIFPKIKDKEKHLPYGLIDLKQGKMSSRLGNVALGEEFLAKVKKEVLGIIKPEIKQKEELAEKISLAAVKYSFLKTGIDKKILFDIKEAINLTGSSGPYLLYAYVRIQSVIKKSQLLSNNDQSIDEVDFSNLKEEKEYELIMKMAKYFEITQKAAKNYDPSEIAKYLFELCQIFNDFYHKAPILKAQTSAREARLALIESVAQIIQNGLCLLGIETVDEM